MARLSRFMPEACVEALKKFLNKEYGLQPEYSIVKYQIGCIFIEMRHFKSEYEVDVPEYLITLLDNKTLPDGEWIPANEVLICRIYDLDPTPKIQDFGTHKSRETPQPFATITFVSTESQIEVRSCKLVEGAWGERRSWPFN
jgi:hypothetical protein